MSVQLLTSLDEDWIYRMFVGARTCYSENSPLVEHDKYTTLESKINLLKQVIRSGHLSVAEHSSLTFMIEGLSRACSHQLVRHRLCSFSHQSQRYVTFQDFLTYTPAAIVRNADAFKIYQDQMDSMKKCYKDLIAKGVKAEDARYVLPNAVCSNMTITMNLRELMHLCNERLCTRAQFEIRDVVKHMAETVVLQQPWLKEFLVPKCGKLGYCPEHQGCGLVKSKEEMLYGERN